MPFFFVLLHSLTGQFTHDGVQPQPSLQQPQPWLPQPQPWLWI